MAGSSGTEGQRPVKYNRQGRFLGRRRVSVQNIFRKVSVLAITEDFVRKVVRVEGRGLRGARPVFQMMITELARRFARWRH